MSRLDDIGASAPVRPAVTSGPVPPAKGVPENPTNAFAEVTVKQLYFFMWKWTVASILFALPFMILSVLLRILPGH